MSSRDTHIGVKFVGASITASILELLFCRQQSLQESVVSGLSTGVGILAVELYVNGANVSNDGYISKTNMSNRAKEVAGGLGTAVGVGLVYNKFILKKPYEFQTVPIKLAIVLVADVVGEYLADYTTWEKTSF